MIDTNVDFLVVSSDVLLFCGGLAIDVCYESMGRVGFLDRG